MSYLTNFFGSVSSVVGAVYYTVEKKVDQIQEKQIPENRGRSLDYYNAKMHNVAVAANLISTDIALNGANSLNTRSISVIVVTTLLPEVVKVVSETSGYKLPKVFTILDDSIIPVANVATIVGSVGEIVRSGITLSPTLMIASSVWSLYQSGVVGKVATYVASFFTSE